MGDLSTLYLRRGSLAMKCARGSRWRIWDLHVHTPASLLNNYSGSDKWERFISDIEALPDHFKVIGINDYLFVDGYRRVLDERAKGRFKNIDLFLPVVELRLDKFCGTTSELQRVNYHVIFSDEFKPEVIQDQFLNALATCYKLSPQYAGLKNEWEAHPTRESLEDLGKMIIASVPKAEQKRFGPPIIEGFNNLNFCLDDIQRVLQKHYFVDKFLTAVGKTEWANIKWNDHSIADKKTIINSVDLVFISSNTPEAYAKARESLTSQGVNDVLLDCSDAHTYSSEGSKDRIGKCSTWIKADTTFKGLQHAIKAFSDRVFIGEIPPKHAYARENLTKFIKSVHLDKVDNSTLAARWFQNVNIGLSVDLVAIIGNKGSGKSALTDILALLGNTRQARHFSFLSQETFRHPGDDLARHFRATLKWWSEDEVTKTLDAEVNPDQAELVRYIPQNFLELICNTRPEGEETEFDKELKNVIFSHVRDEDRLGQESLNEILLYKTGETQRTLQLLRAQLHDINKEVLELEVKSTAEHKAKLESFLAIKQQELAAHEKGRPEEVKPPASDPARQMEMLKAEEAISEKKNERDALGSDISTTTSRVMKLSQLIATIDKVLGKVDNFSRQYDAFKGEVNIDLTVLGIDLNAVAKVQLDKKPLQEKRVTFLRDKSASEAQLNPAKEDSLAWKVAQINQQLQGLQKALDEPHKRHQAYKTALETWELKKRQISGTDTTIGTLTYYERQIRELVYIPQYLQDAKRRRLEKVAEIWNEISALAEAYRKLYDPVQDFIAKHPIAQGQLNLCFEVSIIDSGFKSIFLDHIDRRVAGSFAGYQEAEAVLNSLFDKVDFNNKDSTIAFVEEVMSHLAEDRRRAEVNQRKMHIAPQLKSGRTVQELYDYLYSLKYLEPRYVLKLGEKDLHQLSPGEKGALLLIFYLLVDKDDIPLIIDQPEENLDNQTIYELLVPCIKEAKKRRQVIIVTHNPNLAVVCDAEQVIHASINKKDGNNITYTTGAIENPMINKAIVDVLEGTMPAFKNRDEKYIREKP